MELPSIRTIYGQAYDYFKQIANKEEFTSDYDLDQYAKWIIEYIDNLEYWLDKQDKKTEQIIEKLYCWGETLNADFQKEILEILEDRKTNDN